MGIQNEINDFLEGVWLANNRNKAAAARELNVNSVTFWKWLNSGQKKNEQLFAALDTAGVTLLLNGKPLKSDCEKDEEIKSLSLENERLRKEIRLLEKLVERLEEVDNIKGGQMLKKWLLKKNSLLRLLVWQTLLKQNIRYSRARNPHLKGYFEWPFFSSRNLQRGIKWYGENIFLLFIAFWQFFACKKISFRQYSSYSERA